MTTPRPGDTVAAEVHGVDSTDKFLHQISQELKQAPAVRRKVSSVVLDESEDEIQPSDSISTQGSQRSSRTTSSVRSQRAASRKREIELAARAAIIKQRHEIDCHKRELQRDLEQRELQWRRHVEEQKEKLNYRQQELQIETELQAAQAITRVLDEECSHDDSRSTASKKVRTVTS